MKHLILTLTLAACGTLFAQSSRDTIKFELTQPAMVGNVELPAGTCTVSLMNPANGNTALLFRCESGAQAMVLANPISGASFDSSKPVSVVLTHDGAAYRIDRIWLAAHASGYRIISSHNE